MKSENEGTPSDNGNCGGCGQNNSKGSSASNGAKAAEGVKVPGKVPSSQGQMLLNNFVTQQKCPIAQNLHIDTELANRDSSKQCSSK